MKSVVSSRVFQRINETSAHPEQPPLIIRNTSHTCLSLTGQPVKSSFSIAASLSFPGSVFMYQGDFLACDNVLSPLECILGWDFLIAIHLQLVVLGDSYSLVSPHGATSITPLPQPVKPPDPHISCFSSPASPGCVPEFMQSSDHGQVFVTTKSAVSIPARSECIIHAHIPKSCNDLTGMICSLRGSNDLSYCIVYAVSKAVDRNVAIRILNSCSAECTQIVTSLCSYFFMSESQLN